MKSLSKRAATSLVEVLIVIVLLGLFSAFALARLPGARTSDDTQLQIAHARTQAIRTLSAVTIWIRVHDKVQPLTALPDGSIVSAKDLQRDRLTGMQMLQGHPGPERLKARADR